MKTVTIHRCPVCDTIKGKTDRLVADLKDDPDLRVNVVDGSRGEFTVEVDGRRIDGNETADLAAEIRGSHAPAM